MDQFLVKDYSKCIGDSSKIEYRVLNLKDLFILLEEVKDSTTLKISVYEIGDCLLDWS